MLGLTVLAASLLLLCGLLRNGHFGEGSARGWVCGRPRSSIERRWVGRFLFDQFGIRYFFFLASNSFLLSMFPSDEDVDTRNELVHCVPQLWFC